MVRGYLFSSFILLAWMAENAYSQQGMVEPTLPRYPQIKNDYNRTLPQLKTGDQMLDLYRRTVSQGRHSGMPMSIRMFGEFKPETFKLSPATPGLATTVRLLASDNRNVVLGHARTLRYANSMQSDSRFTVLGLNRIRVTSLGCTDADIVFRHHSTGLQGRIEVKNVSLASQRLNLEKLKLQIVKMSREARQTGETQIWINRQSVLPEITAFAAEHGVKVHERLRTGTKSLDPKDTQFHDFVNQLNREMFLKRKYILSSGGFKSGLGVLRACQAICELQNDIASLKGGRDLLRVGQHGAMFLAGTGLALDGVSQFRFRGLEILESDRLVSIAKLGKRMALVGLGFEEVFLLSQYMTGNLNQQQMWTGQASIAGGFVGGGAGGFVGFKIGAATGGAIGAFFGPAGVAIGGGIGGTLGAFGGGIGGGLMGSHYAECGVKALYRLKDREQQESYSQFLVRHYQSPN